MLLACLIAALGCWCAHQHWMRLGAADEPWRARFWPWAIQGVLVPALAWSAVNLGLIPGLDPLIPVLSEARAKKLPWVELWFAASIVGAAFAATWWAAISYLWLLPIMVRQAPDKKELAFNFAVFGFCSSLCGAAFVWVYGLQHLGAGLVLACLPVVHFTIDLAEKPAPHPSYGRAIGQIKFGKYDQAELELITQLEKSEDDFEGWMMLAELYATQRRDIPAAARVILDISNHPASGPFHISLACHKLADWQLELAENPAGARAALELLCRKLPGSHFAVMAHQRLRQLPRDDQEFAERKNPAPVKLPSLREEDDGQGRRQFSNPSDALAEVRRLIRRLTDDPNDLPVRERLAAILAQDLGKTADAIGQLRLLLDLPDPSSEQKAKWLAQIAAWELHLNHAPEKFRDLLRQIIRDYPQTSQAFAAQRRLFLLDQPPEAATQLS